MTEEDEKNYERLLKGIEFFAKLDVPQHMEHIKRHKEDALCTIRHFTGHAVFHAALRTHQKTA
jgi:hypothetical protein